MTSRAATGPSGGRVFAAYCGKETPSADLANRNIPGIVAPPALHPKLEARRAGGTSGSQAAAFPAVLGV